MTTLTLEPDRLARITGDLRRKIDILARDGGGTIYIPPGRWIVDDSLEEGLHPPELVVPPSVTLWFAPGAVLLIGSPERTLGRSPQRMVIRSRIEADAMRIFQVLDGPSRTGEVQFAGARHTEVLPEWWGAGEGLDSGYRDDQPALMEACNVAFNRFDEGAVEPPLPLILRTGYRLMRPLVIDTPERFRGTGVIIRGAFKGVDATFRAGGTSFGENILVIQERVGSVIENVSFDGQSRVRRCVLLEVVPRVGLPLADLFRGCEFYGASINVEVRAMEGVPRVAGETSRGVVVFERCVFCRPPPTYIGDPLYCFYGVFLDLWPVATARFEHCIFDGRARAMIYCMGGHFAATACSFRNLGDLAAMGTDVDLGAREDSTTSMRLLGASCLLMGCDSVSFHLIHADVASAERQSTLIGVSHRPAVTPVERWSIHWGIGDRVGERARNVTLAMTGCTLTDPVGCETNAGRILDLGNNPDLIADSGMAMGSFVHFPPRSPM